MMSTASNQTNQKPTKPSSTHGKMMNSSNSIATNTRSLQINNNSRSHARKKSSPIWDTDFDGAWEMGRDLIREFVIKQNNRNRSISESDAIKLETMVDDQVNVCIQNDNEIDENHIDLSNQDIVKDFPDKKCVEFDHDEENLMRVAAAATSALFGKNFEVNAYALNVPDSGTFSSTSTTTDSSLLMVNQTDKAIRSEGYETPSTLASWNEIDGNFSTARRLYEREVSNESINHAGITKIIDTENSDCVDSGCEENIHLAALEAKFDQSVEALWNDCKQDESNTMNTHEIQPMQSFWSNYYRNTMENQSNSTCSTEKLCEFAPMNSNQGSLFNLNSNVKNIFATVQPNSLTSNGSSTVGGVNLTASIWSDNPNNQEDDVSFYANARSWEKNQVKAMAQQLNVSFHQLFHLQRNVFIIHQGNQF